MFFKKKKKQAEIAQKEQEIQAIKEHTLEKIDEATKTNEKLRKLLKANGITLNIFVATGGDRRMSK